MQINNETYLRPHEATALVKQLRGCSTGWAAELVERAINSGKVRTHMGGVQNLRRRPGDPPARPITLSNLEDLIYWLDRDAPAPGPLSAAATAQFQPGESVIYAAVLDFLKNEQRPTRAKFTKRYSKLGTRRKLEAAYSTMRPYLKRGRPPKDNSPK